MEADEVGNGGAASDGLDARSMDGESVALTEDAQPIEPGFLQSLTFITVRACALCGHKSNELNPLAAGPFQRSTKFPCWPWLHGTHVVAKGNVCRICEWTFGLGGFNMAHSSIGAMAQSMSRSTTETHEFAACAVKVIELVNAGRVGNFKQGRRWQR